MSHPVSSCMYTCCHHTHTHKSTYHGTTCIHPALVLLHQLQIHNLRRIQRHTRFRQQHKPLVAVLLQCCCEQQSGSLYKVKRTPLGVNTLGNETTVKKRVGGIAGPCGWGMHVEREQVLLVEGGGGGMGDALRKEGAGGVGCVAEGVVCVKGVGGDEVLGLGEPCTPEPLVGHGALCVFGGD